MATGDASAGDPVTYHLDTAEREKLGEVRSRRLIRLGLNVAFWIPAAAMLLLPSGRPLWWNATFAAIFVAIPVAALGLHAKAFPRQSEPIKVPTRLSLMPEGLQVQYSNAPPVVCRWADPDARLSVFEATHPNREPMRWLYLGNESVYQGIRLAPSAFASVSLAAERAGLFRTVKTHEARWPTRRLVWIVYSHPA